MGLLITALLLLFGACALAILRAARPRFRFSWLLALVTVLAAWLVALVLQAQLPSALDVPLWKAGSSTASFMTFAVTATTWPLILGNASLALTLLLTAPGRPRFPDAATWAICLAIVCMGVLALAADSPLTLILFWAALDLIDLGPLLGRQEHLYGNDQVPYAFAMKLGSISLVMMAFVLGEPGSAGAKFAEMQPSAALALLPAAALLRLGAFALPLPKGAGQDDVETVLELTAGATSVGFLGQLIVPAGGPVILIPCALATLYAGWMVLRAPDFQEARPLWILGLGSLAVAAAVLGNPIGAAAWACAIFLVGGPLFVTSMADSWSRRALLGGLWIISALPFSLTAAVWSASGNSWSWMLPFFIIGQAMLLAGSLRPAFSHQAKSAMRVEVMALRGLQYIGFGLPLSIGVLLGFGGWPGALHTGAPLAAVLLLPLTGGLVWAKRRLPLLNPGKNEWFPKWIGASSTTVSREVSLVGLSLQRLAAAITRTMEGEAGIMWGLLFLVLFVSLIAGGNR